jgi:hypothetical protein
MHGERIFAGAISDILAVNFLRCCDHVCVGWMIRFRLA